MLFLKQRLVLPFLCNRSTTVGQIESSMVSNFKLKPSLRNCVKMEIIEPTSPPQQLHKRGTIFCNGLYNVNDRA